MYGQLQCVYGGRRHKHSVFRGQELRIRRRKIILALIVCLFAIFLVYGILFRSGIFNQTARAATDTTISIAASIAAVESQAASAVASIDESAEDSFSA